jgi:hypothetical protein
MIASPWTDWQSRQPNSPVTGLDDPRTGLQALPLPTASACRAKSPTSSAPPISLPLIEMLQVSETDHRRINQTKRC